MKKNWNSAYMVKAFARLPFDVTGKDKRYLPRRLRAVRYLPARLWWFCRSCHDPALCPVFETWRLSGCNQYRRKCRE